MRHKLFTALALLALLLSPGLFPALAAQSDLRWSVPVVELAVTVAPATLFRVTVPMLAEQTLDVSRLSLPLTANAMTPERWLYADALNVTARSSGMLRTSALSTARFYVSEVATRIAPRCRDVRQLARA